MKKNVLALSIATAVVGFAGSAHAVTDVSNGTNVGVDEAGTAVVSTALAEKLAFSDNGIGHALLVPYFSTQNGNATLLSLVNTDMDNGKAVKVRFRGAKNSDDIMDFQVFLSPGDVWTANISQDADGISTLTTEDNSCTRPSNVNSKFVTTRVNPNAKNGVASETLEGYVEIFNMADVPKTSSIYNVIKHKSNGVAPCGNATVAEGIEAWNSLTRDRESADAWATLFDKAVPETGVGFATPTTGLMANWTIMNVPKALSWSGTATAIVAALENGTASTGRIVYFPQQPTIVTKEVAAGYTADPLLVSGKVSARLFDFPDMSTPYTAAAAPTAPVTEADQQAKLLADSIATTNVINEFWTDDTILANTDWVFSMPTRRYAVAMDYLAKDTSGAIKPAIVENLNVNTHFALTANADATPNPVVSNVTAMGDAICVTDVTPATTGREEEFEPSDDVISPGDNEQKRAFCGETSILSFGNGSTAERSAVLGAAIALSDVPAKYQNGWANIGTPGSSGVGMPIIGGAFASAYNQAVDEGTAGNFSVNWGHRFHRTAQ